MTHSTRVIIKKATRIILQVIILASLAWIIPFGALLGNKEMLITALVAYIACFIYIFACDEIKVKRKGRKQCTER